MRVDGVTYLPVVQPAAAGSAAGAAAQVGKAFMEYLAEAIGDVAELQSRAAALQDAFARGEYENVHEVVIAAQEAGVALDLVLAIRNQVVQAYQEIMRMQI